MKIFNWENFMNKEINIVVRCKTEEEANDFCKQMHEHGLKWGSGCSYLTENNWYYYRQNTCYSNHGEYARYVFYKSEGYVILEWSDYMKKDFTKADLRVGDIVKLENGSCHIIISNNNCEETGLALFSKSFYGCIHYLSSYTDNLVCKTNPTHTIIAVYKGSEPYKRNTYSLMKEIFTNDNTTNLEPGDGWDWIREEPVKEMTMAELEKHFGCKVKIVSDKN